TTCFHSALRKRPSKRGVPVVAAVVFSEMADLFLAALRRLVNKSRHTRPQTGVHTAPAAPEANKRIEDNARARGGC
ncbi:hypothetical protein ACWDAZ_19030, partial [Streptomyces sp. NPDC001215]